MRPIQAPRPLAEDAADRIRDEILSGRLSRGERLVESRIAAELHVSRGPVREAFKLLRAEGLLEEEPRRGTYVVSLSPDDVRELYDLRAAVEGRAAKLVARVASRARTSRQLRARLDALEPRPPRRRRARRLPRRPRVPRHRGRGSARNSRLHAVFSRSRAAAEDADRPRRAPLRVAADEIAEEHRPLLEAIEDGDGDEAVARASRRTSSAPARWSPSTSTRSERHARPCAPMLRLQTVDSRPFRLIPSSAAGDNRREERCARGRSPSRWRPRRRGAGRVRQRLELRGQHAQPARPSPRTCPGRSGCSPTATASPRC